MRKLRYVASQNPPLGPVIMSLSELIGIRSAGRPEEIRNRQKKLSEVADMIHAAQVFHRCVRDKTANKVHHQETIMSLLFGDYLLAQSSVDLADLRYPQTVGLIAKGLEDYTRGEFLKLKLFGKKSAALDDTVKIPSKQELHDEINRYAEFTCGSLLSNACLSVAILAGHPDRTDNSLSDLVFNFGLHTGTAHRLLELFHNPDTNSELDRDFIRTNLSARDFECSIQAHIEESVGILMNLPDGDKRHSLLALLDTMKNRSKT